jgi:GDPmannose 4,6-dehydratase
VTARKALIIGITGQDGAYLTQFLLEKGYLVHGTSRDVALARLDNLASLGVRDQVFLHSMSPVDFQSVEHTIECIEPHEIYNLSGQSSVALSCLPKLC